MAEMFHHFIINSDCSAVTDYAVSIHTAGRVNIYTHFVYSHGQVVTYLKL